MVDETRVDLSGMYLCNMNLVTQSGRQYKNFTGWDINHPDVKSIEEVVSMAQYEVGKLL